MARDRTAALTFLNLSTNGISKLIKRCRTISSGNNSKCIIESFIALFRVEVKLKATLAEEMAGGRNVNNGVGPG